MFLTFVPFEISLITIITKLEALVFNHLFWRQYLYSQGMRGGGVGGSCQRRDSVRNEWRSFGLGIDHHLDFFSSLTDFQPSSLWSNCLLKTINETFLKKEIDGLSMYITNYSKVVIKCMSMPAWRNFVIRLKKWLFHLKQNINGLHKGALGIVVAMRFFIPLPTF